MAAPKRTKFQKARDQAEIAALYLQGKTQMKITEEFNKDKTRGYTLSQPIISRDLRQIQSEWLSKSMMDFNSARAEQLAKIDKLEVEYWNAWERSKKERKKTKSKQEVKASKQVSNQSVEMSSEESTGNVEYLKRVEWCIDRRCELLGLDAPKRMHVTETPLDAIPWATATNSQLEQIRNGVPVEKVFPNLAVNRN